MAPQKLSFGCCIALLICITLLQTNAFCAEAPTVEQMLGYLNIDATQKKALMSGQIISREIGDASDKELALGMIMFVPVPVKKMVDSVAPEKMFKRNTDVIVSGELTGSASDKITGIKFSADEAKDLINVEPGSDFNLSTDEIKSLNALKDQVQDESKIPDVVAKEYGRLLLKRFQAYRKGGFSAIAPYDRGDGDFSKPGDELVLSLKSSKFLSNYFPDIMKALLNFPKDQLNGMVSRFFWFEEKIEKRPGLLLSHWTYYTSPQGVLVVDRQYYVGDTYNSMLREVGYVPVDGGTIVLYAHRTSTDQVAGFMSGMKHNIGRGQMKEDLLQTFTEARAAVMR